MIKSYTETANRLAQEHNAKLDAERDEGLDSLRATDDASRAVQKTERRVSLNSIIEKIEHVDYINPPRHPHLTLAIITLANGFVVIGKSAPADPKNYDKALGEKFAYKDAIRQVWPLEGYLLREKLSDDV